MSIHSMLTDTAKKMPFLRTIARNAVYKAHKLKYRLTNYRKNGLDEKLVLFETFNGRSYACSPKAIYLAMLEDERFADYRFVWAFQKPKEKGALLPDHERTEVVLTNSDRFFDICASAGTIVVNSNFPARVKLKKEQTLLETWHGTPLKRLGYDIDTSGKSGDAMNSIRDIHKRYDENSKRFTYLVSPSPFATEKLSSAFNLAAIGKQDIMLEIGYPRNDMLINHTAKDIERVKTDIGIPANKKILLYAPTYRDNSHQSCLGYTYKEEMDFESLKKALGDEWVVLFRAHYFVANSFDFEKHQGFVYDVSKLDDINELYIISDVLVTDYSSVFFDYANLERPMLFYMYDLEQYRDNLRGFYFDYNEVPGPVVREQSELEKELGRLDTYFERYGDRYRAFREKFNPLDDGHVSEKVLDILINDRNKQD